MGQGKNHEAVFRIDVRLLQREAGLPAPEHAEHLPPDRAD